MKQVELKKHKFEYPGMSKLKALSGNSGASRFHWGQQFNDFVNKNSNSYRKLEVEILKEDIKSAVMGKPPGLEKKEYSLLKTLFDIFGPSKVLRNQQEVIKLILLASRNLSVETMV